MIVQPKISVIELGIQIQSKYFYFRVILKKQVLFSAVHYPANYGFIPQTYCDDKDPLDILVLCSVDVEPMCLIEAKVIGVMRMIDQGEIDDKIISVAKNDASVNYINDIKVKVIFLKKN